MDVSGTMFSAAALKWILKDGIGAFGQILISTNNFNFDFDKDPQRWRFYAEIITLTGNLRSGLQNSHIKLVNNH